MQETLPPYRHISSKPITTEYASNFIATFVANSELHAHLHPDALITPTGVQFSSHGGSVGGVVLHNLRRVAAGLRGEHLEPEPTPEPEERPEEGKKKRSKGGEEVEAAPVVAEEEWQDLEEYEREQEGVEVGEIGERDNFVASGGEVPDVDTTAGAEDSEAVGEKRKSKVDKSDSKEARKKAKKEREKEFKRDKERQKRAEADD